MNESSWTFNSLIYDKRYSNFFFQKNFRSNTKNIALLFNKIIEFEKVQITRSEIYYFNKTVILGKNIKLFFIGNQFIIFFIGNLFLAKKVDYFSQKLD